MADPIVVTGLLAKRSEVAGMIDNYRKQIAGLQAGLAHLDATIHLFAPGAFSDAPVSPFLLQPFRNLATAYQRSLI